MKHWNEFLTERDKEVFELSGHGARAEFGTRPVLLVVDVNHHFLGDDPDLDIPESIRRWPNSCGREGWVATRRIEQLLAEARAKGVPVIYSTGIDPRPDGFDRGRWLDKSSSDTGAARPAIGNTIVPPIAPQEQDIVIRKRKPSAFFGTTLASYLIDLQADSVIVCGGTTSGCVRATVVDGFSLNYRMSVIEECTFDRGEASHAINLFDMHQKYADVVGMGAAVEYLRALPEGMFDERMPSLRAARTRADAEAQMSSDAGSNVQHPARATV